MIIHNLIFDISIITGIDSSRAISTSKIIKITAIKKNCDENGGVFGSNPHSSGDLFPQSSLTLFFQISVANVTMNVYSKRVIIVVVIIIIFIFFFTNFLIGSQVYFLVLDKYCFIFLISRLRCIGINKLRI
jgi:hypothetical protein